MSQILGIVLLAFGMVLIVTRRRSAEFHERWNRKFTWTQWATGPSVMRASEICNIVAGISLIALAVPYLLGVISF